MDFEQKLKVFGDRSSSEVTAYSHFKSFESSSGLLRYQESHRLRIAAAEPLAPQDARASIIQEFAHTITEKKTVIALPVSQQLAAELSVQGFDTLPIGQEPVFELEEYFLRTPDPLESLANARILRLKGYEVQVKASNQLRDDELQQIKNLFEAVQSQRSLSLSFLSELNPFERFDQKTFFMLVRQGQIEAYVTGLDIAPIRGVYFADWVRPTQNRAGAMEFLLIESMRRLFKQGIREVRMGMVPFEGVENSQLKGWIQKVAFRGAQWILRKSKIYSVQGISNFKKRLSPTRWETLFLASQKKLTFFSLFSLSEALLQKTFLEWMLFKTQESFVSPPLKILPKSFKEFLRATRYTTALVGAMAALHFLQTQINLGVLSYESVGFRGAQFSFTGFLLGPFYHDHLFHLAGDLSTFWMIGAVVELFLGQMTAIILTALGFWATNPLAIVILKLSLGSEAFQKVMMERDYGSSNAIYAFVGGLAARLTHPAWVLIPFIANGALVCIGRGSWLAIHHWVGLAVGFIYVKWMTKLKG